MSATSSPATGSTATTGDPAEVELRLPADGAYASVLRTLTAGLAAVAEPARTVLDQRQVQVDEGVTGGLTLGGGGVLVTKGDEELGAARAGLFDRLRTPIAPREVGCHDSSDVRTVSRTA